MAICLERLAFHGMNKVCVALNTALSAGCLVPGGVACVVSAPLHD
jgi:hypothetical protein